jgi:GPH family glycoside/pentoside/hexuronide:cation symporter
LLFFLSAALSTPLWSRMAQRHGARRVLLAGMALAIVTFLWAASLGAGQVWAFAAICAASGAALGADMVLLPAIFARRLAVIGQGSESAAFGLWSFVSKLSLALAAATLLPLLDLAGFVPGAANAPSALSTLSALYALLPCALKLAAIALLARTPEV